MVGGSGGTRRGVGVGTEEGKRGGGVGEGGRAHFVFPTWCARCKRRASRAHLYVQPSLSKGNGISRGGVGYNGEEEKRAIATGVVVVDPWWMIAGTTA